MESNLNFAQALASVAATFGAGLLGGYWFTRLRYRKRSTPKIGANLKIRTTSGIYRSKLVAIEHGGWRISAPLSRDSYVPFRVGETITVEAPGEHCVYVFKTEVTLRDLDSAEIVLAPPSYLSPQNRRLEQRIPAEEEVRVDGVSGQLKNLSANGARVWTDGQLQRGDRVRLEMHDRAVYGWVVDVWPIRGISDYRDDVRLRFEEELTFSA